MRQLKAGIQDFIDAHHADPTPFVWTKSADEILASIIAHDVTFLPSDVHGRFADNVAEVRRMLTSFIQTVG